MNKYINFHIGGLFEKHDLLKILLAIYKNENYKFYDYANITSLFGSVKCNWNGGRVINDFWNTDMDKIANYMKTIYPDIQCRLTLTNMLINTESLHDIVGNKLLKCFYFGNNGIILYSSILEDYVRSNFPNYNIISSVTKGLSEKETISELNKDYHMVVINTNIMGNDEFVRSLPNKNKAELIVNDICGIYCPKRKEHYLEYSKCQIDNTHAHHCTCDDGPGPFFEQMKKPLFISNEDILNKYYPLGICNYKIQGRTDYDYDFVETLVYYLIQPEYQIEVRGRLMLKDKY